MKGPARLHELLGSLRPGARPLEGKSVYLHSVKSRESTVLAEVTRRLGGSIESFLNRDVSFLVTGNRDGHATTTTTSPHTKTTPHPKTTPPHTKTTPHPKTTPPHTKTTPHPKTTPSLASVGVARAVANEERRQTQTQGRSPASTNPVAPVCKSRGRALLEKAIHNNNERSGGGDVLASARSWGVKILHVDHFMWCLDLLTERSKQKRKTQTKVPEATRKVKAAVLKVPFIKVEDCSRRYRPLYSQCMTLPELNYATRFSPFEAPTNHTPKPSGHTHKHKDAPQEPPEKSPPGSSADVPSPPNPPRKSHPLMPPPRISTAGYCECCMQAYNHQEQHLKSEQHVRFAQDSANYALLDQLIGSLHCPFHISPAHNQDLQLSSPQSISGCEVNMPSLFDQEAETHTHTHPHTHSLTFTHPHTHTYTNSQSPETWKCPTTHLLSPPTHAPHPSTLTPDPPNPIQEPPTPILCTNPTTPTPDPPTPIPDTLCARRDPPTSILCADTPTPHPPTPTLCVDSPTPTPDPPTPILHSDPPTPTPDHPTPILHSDPSTPTLRSDPPTPTSHPATRPPDYPTPILRSDPPTPTPHPPIPTHDSSTIILHCDPPTPTSHPHTSTLCARRNSAPWSLQHSSRKRKRKHKPRPSRRHTHSPVGCHDIDSHMCAALPLDTVSPARPPALALLLEEQRRGAEPRESAQERRRRDVGVSAETLGCDLLVGDGVTVPALSCDRGVESLDPSPPVLLPYQSEHSFSQTESSFCQSECSFHQSERFFNQSERFFNQSERSFSLRKRKRLQSVDPIPTGGGAPEEGWLLPPALSPSPQLQEENMTTSCLSELGPPLLQPYFLFDTPPKAQNPPKSPPTLSPYPLSSVLPLAESWRGVALSALPLAESWNGAGSSDSDWDSGLLLHLEPADPSPATRGSQRPELQQLLHSYTPAQDSNYHQRLCSALHTHTLTHTLTTPSC